MIYKSIETLPWKRFLKIVDDIGNIKLLTEDVDNPDYELLGKIWQSMAVEYQDLDPKKEGNKMLLIEREISALECKHDFIQLAITALEFQWDDELVDELRGYGYKLTTENYYDDLKKIQKESKAIIMKANQFKAKLPKVDEQQKKAEKFNPDEVLAFYSRVVGYDFDFNTVSVTKVHGIQKQVDIQLKAIDRQVEAAKKRK